MQFYLAHNIDMLLKLLETILGINSDRVILEKFRIINSRKKIGVSTLRIVM